MLRFFAIPKPPGKNNAWKFSGFKSDNGFICPLEILALSSKIFLCSVWFEPFVWFIATQDLFGAKHSYWICALDKLTSIATLSWISLCNSYEPSYTPHPDSIIAALFCFAIPLIIDLIIII